MGYKAYNYAVVQFKNGKPITPAPHGRELGVAAVSSEIESQGNKLSKFKILGEWDEDIEHNHTWIVEITRTNRTTQRYRAQFVLRDGVVESVSAHVTIDAA